MGVGNAYSSLKSMERPINLYIKLFDNHSPFQKSSFFFCYSKYILGEVLDKYVQKFEKKKYIYIYILQKCIFALERIYSFLAYNLVIWYVLNDYIHSLKHIPLTYFRSIP